MNKIEFSEIKGIEILDDSGAQAIVYKIPPGTFGENALALKKYKQEKIKDYDETAVGLFLDQLINIKNSMSDNHKKILTQYTTWPKQIVYENGKVCGYIMNLIPGMFYSFPENPFNGKKKPTLSSLDFILQSIKFREDENLPRINDKGMARITSSLLNTLAVLHEEGIIAGDLSPGNIILYIDSYDQAKNRPLFIDTDSFRKDKQTNPLKQLHTPNWETPEYQNALDELQGLPVNTDPHKRVSLEIASKIQNKETDIYKICLAITRLYHDGEHRPSIVSSPFAQEKLAKKISKEFSNLVTLGLSDDPKKRPKITTLYECLIEGLNSKVK
jgi:serine/threonine protein kinase